MLIKTGQNFLIKQRIKRNPLAILYKNNKIKYRGFSMIKGIIEKYLNKRVYFQIVELPSIVNNAEILASWIELELIKTPKLHKSIVKRVLKEYKRWSVY